MIFAPSTIRCPLFDVAEALSEPARSTSESLEFFITVLEDDYKNDDSILTCRIAWEREEA